MARAATRRKEKTKSKTKFAYKKRSTDQVEKRANRSGGDFDSVLNPDIKTFTPKEGDYAIRILPPAWDDAEHYGYDLHVHYQVGSDEQAYLCFNKHKGKPCPICEESFALKKDGDTDEAKQISAKNRVAVYIIDRDDEDAGPQIWSMPFTVDKDISKRCIDKRNKSVLPIDDPEDGYDVEFTREGSGLRTKYVGIEIARSSSPLHEDEDLAEEWLEAITEHPLPDCLNFYDYDYVKSIYDGKPVGGSDSDDDGENEDPPIENEEEEEEERPRRRRSRDEKEEEEDPPWNEEEEEEGEEEEEEPEKESPRLSRFNRRRGKK